MMIEVHDFIGYCPKLDADRQISVEYEVLSISQNRFGYKKRRFDCIDKSCEYYADATCPAFRKAHP